LPNSTALEIVDSEIKLKSKLVPYGAVKSRPLIVKGRVKQALWEGDYLIDLRIGNKGTIVTDKTFINAIENLVSNLTTPLPVWCLEVKAISRFLLSLKHGKESTTKV